MATTGNPPGDVAVGVDVGGGSLKAVLVDAGGAVLQRASRPTGERTTAVDLARSIAGACRESLDSEPGRVSLGIGIAGVIGADGVLLGSPNLPCLVGTRPARELADLFPGAPCIDNDAHCAALAEGWNGAAAGASDFLAVTLGSGVGSGLILSGRVFHGATGYGCELGHSVLVAGGRRCGCGNRGCLEAYVSETAAREYVAEADRRLQALVGGRVDQGEGHAQALFALADAGDAEASRIVSSMIEALGVGLASAVNMFDVPLIVLGGGIAPAVVRRSEELRGHLASNLFARSPQSVSIRIARHGASAGAIGAARLAMLAR